LAYWTHAGRADVADDGVRALGFAVTAVSAVI
jgi:hypothetical protein